MTRWYAAAEPSLAGARTALQLRGFAIMRPEDYDVQRRRARSASRRQAEDW